MPLKIYTLSNCDTCRRATKWLQAQNLDFAEIAIRQQPPSLAELRRMLGACNGDLRRLFNTSGRDYRDQKIGDRLDALSVDEALRLLATNGNLVKRPFLVGHAAALVGFDEPNWRETLLTR